MKRLIALLTFASYLFPFTSSFLPPTTIPFPCAAHAQGWPENYSGVMMQGFSWDDYDNTQWVEMESQANELAEYFSLIWVPQSGNCDGKSMGYNPLYYYDHNSSFGTEAELRSMIKTFKAKGIGTIADVVINHRKTVSNWFDFPAETYKGMTYQMFSTDICADDDGGKAAAEAKKQGVELSPNKDTGEGWDGFRDLDHVSENVQNNIFAYEDFLLNDLGYTGFRYDVAKGFAAKYFGMYNAKAKPEFSVGEYWDGNTSNVRNWINGTKVDGIIQSGAFDFPFRYTVRDAFNNSNNYSALNNESLNKNKNYRRYAVTFVENHDTQDRTATGGERQDPIKNATDIPACNAVLLAMPGTPCVFQPHWLKHKTAIKQMILARKAAGITNTSDYTVHEASSVRFMVECGDLLCIVGGSNNAKAKELGFSLVHNGNKYYYYLRNSLNMPWISEPSGKYDATKASEIRVKITAVTDDANAQLVYTTDGTEPTVTSTIVASGSEMKINETTTLKVGILSGGTVKNIVTRKYEFITFEPYDATIYVKADFSPVYFYAWDSSNQLNGDWPGQQVDNTAENQTTINGEIWLKQTFHIGNHGYYFNIIFNNGNGKQTIDITRINTDKYYIARLDATSQKGVSFEDVTEQYSSGLEEVFNDNELNTQHPGIYTLDGRLINMSSDTKLNKMPQGIYIINGKKVIKP